LTFHANSHDNPVMKLPITPKEFRATILSHGYFWLSPVIGTETPPSIIIPYNLPTRHGCIRISTNGQNVELESLSGTDKDAFEIASNCLSLDEDLMPIRKIARTDSQWKWIIDEKKGRFLRSPSLFEDCLKAILTINTNWKRSVLMSGIATEKYGALTGAKFLGKAVRTFPAPNRIARESEESLKEILRCGFRAKFILSLADAAIENPDFYLGDNWRLFSSDDFCDEIAAVSGMGPMSQAYISRLYGKTNSYHMDSWVIRRCAELWGLSPNQIDDHVRHRYGEFGQYGPAIFWFELTRYWHFSEAEALEKEV
jgi:3-methyladenine DNA glycosylase/8-oxoguanine DNA glycosylase